MFEPLDKTMQRDLEKGYPYRKRAPKWVSILAVAIAILVGIISVIRLLRM